MIQRMSKEASNDMLTFSTMRVNTGWFVSDWKRDPVVAGGLPRMAETSISSVHTLIHARNLELLVRFHAYRVVEEVLT